MALFLNPACGRPCPGDGVLTPDGAATAEAEIATWPGYAPSPLRDLAGLAAALGVGAVRYKDEGGRFGLKSFKACGRAYAVLCLLKDHLRAVSGGGSVSSAYLLAGRYRDQISGVTVATATDGNHGRSVAWRARMFGCHSIIYLHEHVSAMREVEIAALGAEIRRVKGGYDHSVRRCADNARVNGWSLGADRPRIVAVEPTRADCISRSLAAGRPTAVPSDVNTFMACLAVSEVSPVTWQILARGLDDALSIPDEAVMETMHLLAEGADGAPAPAGLIAPAQDDAVCAALGLSDRSRMVVIGSEGATDTETHPRIVGRSAEAVERRAA